MKNREKRIWKLKRKSHGARLRRRHVFTKMQERATPRSEMLSAQNSGNFALSWAAMSAFLIFFLLSSSWFSVLIFLIHKRWGLEEYYKTQNQILSEKKVTVFRPVSVSTASLLSAAFSVPQLICIVPSRRCLTTSLPCSWFSFYHIRSGGCREWSQVTTVNSRTSASADAHWTSFRCFDVATPVSSQSFFDNKCGKKHCCDYLLHQIMCTTQGSLTRTLQHINLTRVLSIRHTNSVIKQQGIPHCMGTWVPYFSCQASWQELTCLKSILYK